jgi:hypothetical protein
VKKVSVFKNVRCLDCKEILIKEDEPCKKCGSNRKEVLLNITETIELHDQIKGNVKEKGIKKPRKEFIYGDDLQKTENKWRDKTRIIDRENDHYYEKVINKETGEIIHECDEPLSDHWGHGSAKNKDMK